GASRHSAFGKRTGSMKALWIGLALLLAVLAPKAMAQSAGADPSGDWRGTISAGEVTLRVVLHLGETSTFDSLDQGAIGVPAQMTVEGRGVVVTIAGVG